MDECLAKINGHQYHLELGPAESSIYFDRNQKNRPCLIFTRGRETQFSNIALIRMLVIHLGPPWFSYYYGILNTSEEAGI